MKEMIDIFRMAEISVPRRIRIIIQLGNAINDTHGMNLTEGLVYELVKALDPFNQEVENEHYKKHIKNVGSVSPQDKSVEIKKHLEGTLKWPYHECPKCHRTDVLPEDYYCSKCGSKIVWIDKKEEKK